MKKKAPEVPLEFVLFAGSYNTDMIAKDLAKSIWDVMKNKLSRSIGSGIGYEVEEWAGTKFKEKWLEGLEPYMQQAVQDAIEIQYIFEHRFPAQSLAARHKADESYVTS